MTTRPHRRGRLLPPDYDPGRRLVAAVTLKAVEDYLYPPKNLSQRARHSAREFLLSHDGSDILTKLGIPTNKLEQLNR